MLITSKTMERIDNAKINSKKLVKNLRLAGLTDYANRIERCAKSLKANIFYDEKGKQKTSISKVFYCKVGFCPVCNLAKSRKMAVLMNQGIKRLKETKNLKLKFVTLTQKNCSLKSLRNELKLMNCGFKYLKRDARFNDYLRKLEITLQQKNGTLETDEKGMIICHPHYHLLIPMEEYMSINELRQLWKEKMKLDYLPVCRIENVSKKWELELSKYLCKPMDILSIPINQLENFISQTAYQKSLVSGGVFKDYFRWKELKSINENLTLGSERKIESEWWEEFEWNEQENYYSNPSSNTPPINRSFEIFAGEKIYEDRIN